MAKTILFAMLGMLDFHKESMRVIVSYPVSHPHLEDWTILLRPSLCHFRMIRSELMQTSIKRQTRNFWQTLDMWRIRAVEELIEEEA